MEPMLVPFGRVLHTLQFSPARTPIVSNVTGVLDVTGRLSTPDYWVEHVRQAVRFADGVRALHAAGASTFVEIGPHSALTALARDTLSEVVPPPQFVATARKDGALTALHSALTALFAEGLTLDWGAILPKARRVQLPTYAFQRQRYWLESSERADLSTAGLTATTHPLLGASVALADNAGYVFSGLISQRGQPWLTGHDIHGSVLLPAAAFLDLAWFTAHSVGLARIDELTLETPLALPEHGDTLLQVSLSALDAGGRRRLQVHSRAQQVDDAAGESPWIKHVGATLAPRTERDPAELVEWPPIGAVQHELSDLYEGLLPAHGLRYSRDFKGLRALWSRGHELFAEVELPADAVTGGLTPRFAVHPALLDAALHAIVAHWAEREGITALPFSVRDRKSVV
jgi:acyl transferase domain-containing protein